jgi:protein Mpv17
MSSFDNMNSAILSSTLQAVCLGAASNIIAQLITSNQEGVSVSIPRHLSLLRPSPRHRSQYPSPKPYHSPSSPSSPLHSTSSGKSSSSPSSKAPLNLTNTIIKFLLDQSIGSSLNTVGFLAYFASLQQASYDHVLDVTIRDFWPVTKAGWKLWPLVSLLNFTVVPLHQRVIVVTVAGMFWSIYMSLLMAG